MPVEIVTNLFTNPNLVGSGAVEVRRNLWKTPAMSNTAMVTAQGATLTVVADGLRVTSTGTSPYRATTNASQRVAVSPSTSYRVTARRIIGSAIGTATGMNGRMGVVGYDSAGSHRSNAYSLTLGTAPKPGTEVIEQQITTPDWVVALEVNFVSGSNNGDEVVWGRVSFTTEGGYFDGNSSPDPDLTASWTGPVDGSASILTGVAVTGVPSIPDRCLAIRSSKTVDGVAYPLRLIARGTSNDTYVAVSIPAPARTGGTVVATRYQGAVIANASARALWVGNPAQVTPLVNEVGARECRLSFGALTDSYTARLYHGGAQGSPDVYWALPGIFTGTYDGPSFSGSTAPRDEGAAWVSFSWDGAPDASTSSMRREVRLVAQADMAPVPRVLIDAPITSFPPGAVTVRIVRTAEGRTFDVRGAVRLPATSPAIIVDPEAPFGVESSYSLIGYDEDGVIVGEVPFARVTLEYHRPVIQQPLDPRLAVEVRRLVTTGAELMRETPGEVAYAEGRVLPGLVALGPRRGLRDVQLDLFVATYDDADQLQATLGTYDRPQLPVWLLRTPPGQRIPRVFFCHVPQLTEININGHIGMEYVQMSASVTEVSPPAAGIVATALTHSDMKVFFSTHSEVRARYATHSDVKRDTSLIGAADGS